MGQLHLHMGRYAAYVWPAWGLTLLVLGAITLATLRSARRWRREVERRETESRPAGNRR